MKAIRDACALRDEVLTGDLQDAIFAADFGHVIEGVGPIVYRDPAIFFSNTHPTKNLKSLLQTVFRNLKDASQPGAAIRLSTGFGGGKTHTLITFWHLAKNIDSTLGYELLPAADRPRSVTVVGVDGGKGLATGTLWGDIALKLGALSEAKARALDATPEASILRGWLPNSPVLILLDELVIALSEMSEQQQNATIAFINRLVGEIRARTQALLIVTDTAGQAAYEEQAQAIGTALGKSGAEFRLDSVLGRSASDFDPIGDEGPEVINRRLFKRIEVAAAEAASVEYPTTYERIKRDDPSILPDNATTREYAARIRKSYPFHPRLLDTTEDRLAAIQDFNKGRGTLRLFARILRDVWDSDSQLPLISAGDINWESQSIQGDLLGRLNRERFKAAVNADVRDHATRLDEEYSTDMHRRVASALLLESLPLTPSSGMDKRDLALATLRPSDVGHEPGEAVDRLMAECWHLYKDDSGVRYQFRYEPNLNKQIEERANSVSREDARTAINAAVQQFFTGVTFETKPFPSSPRAVSDSARLKLVVAGSGELAQAVCDYDDNSDPAAPQRRRFRNAIFAIAPTTNDLNEAIQAKRREMAAVQLREEKSNDKQARQAIDELLTILRRRARIAALRSWNRVYLQGRPSLSLDEKYLIAESALGDTTLGQPRLKDFLDEKNIIYKVGESIDVDLLLDSIVTGATPSVDHPGAVNAKAVHERALANERLRLLLNADPLLKSVRKAIEQKRLVLRMPNGEVYDGVQRVSGPAGARLSSAAPIPAFDLNDDVLLATPDAQCVAEWIRVDAPRAPASETIPLADAATQKGATIEQIREAIVRGQLDTRTVDGEERILQNEVFQRWTPTTSPIADYATTWEDAIAFAGTRSVESVKLTASTPSAAQTLAVLAQPFGAQSLELYVNVGGSLKDGGTLNFLVQGVKLTHPLKPLEDAVRFARGLANGGRFNVSLTLNFSGQTGTIGPEHFERAKESATDGIGIEAHFGGDHAQDS